MDQTDQNKCCDNCGNCSSNYSTKPKMECCQEHSMSKEHLDMSKEHLEMKKKCLEDKLEWVNEQLGKAE